MVDLPRAGLSQRISRSRILFLFFDADLVQTPINRAREAIAFAMPGLYDQTRGRTWKNLKWKRFLRQRHERLVAARSLRESYRVLFQWIPTEPATCGCELAQDLARRAAHPNREIAAATKLKSATRKKPKRTDSTVSCTGWIQEVDSDQARKGAC